MRILQQIVIRFILPGLCLLVGMSAEALTLGDMVVHSRPGQPLSAIIPVSLEKREVLAQIRVEQASAQMYAEHQLARQPVLEGMRFALLDKGEGRARIQLYGERPWQGEEALLLLQLKWPQGQLTQPFRLAAVDLRDEQQDASPRYVEVGEKDTLDAIAIRLSRDSNRSYLHMMYALFKSNPDGFYGGNMNNLRGGVRLKVPTEAELYQLTDAEVFGGIREQYSQWRQQRESQGRSSETGAALAGMSDEEAAALAEAESPEALQKQLKQLLRDNEAIHQRNAELKARLARLEQQMQQMTQRVLDYPVTPLSDESVGNPPAGVAKTKPVALAESPKQGESEEQSGQQEAANQSAELPSYLLLLMMLLTLLAGGLVWRYATRARQGAT